MFSRRSGKSNPSKVEPAPKNKKKSSTTASKKVPTATGEFVKPLPSSTSSSSFSSKTSSSDNSSSEKHSINLIEINTDAWVATEQELPYAKYVNLTPEQRKFHCQIRVMAHEVKYSMVTTILKSWEQDLKVIPNWDKIGGEILFRKMFELEPECIRMFGFPSGTKFDDPALSTNDKFIKKGSAFIAMLDIALSLLGPDLEPLEEELVRLGGRHVTRQCKPKHWPMVGVALFHTLETLLGNKFTKEIQDYWIKLYNFMGYHMIQGLIQNGGPTWEDNEIALAAIVAADLPTKELPYAKYVNLTPEQRKFHCQTPVIAHDIKFSMVSTITNCWEQDLKIIPNWDTIGGEILFRKMFELEPECIRMFGFPSDTKFDDPALSTNDKFIKKGTTFIAMLDIALTLLGPNLAPLEAELVKLGGRHVARQCKPKHWPMVGVALFYTLEMLLGYKFTKEVQDCWIVLYNFLGYHMIQGLIQNGGPTWEDNEIALAAIAAADLPTKELPYAKYVNLTPEQRKFHCQTPVIAHDIKFSMVSTITNCWEQDLKIIPNWDKIGGEILFRKMFELEPECIRMFGFPSDTKFDDPALSKNNKFINKSATFIAMLDIALSMLGPNLSPLEAELVKLGGRHVARQCKPKHWPMVGVALFYTLEMILGNKFTKEVQDCWIVLYNFLGYHMIQGLIQNGGPTWEDNEIALAASAAANLPTIDLPYAKYVTLTPDERKFHCQTRVMAHEVKYSMVSTITNSWELDLKVIPNWEKIGGEFLLRKMFELEPDSIRMFGFPSDTKFDDPALTMNDKFIKKGGAFIAMLDIALSLLGPDLEPLEEELIRLGGRHVARQCKPKHWPTVGVALFCTLEMLLGDKFTKDVQDCWIVLYNFLGYHMIQGLIQNGGPTWEDN